MAYTLHLHFLCESILLNATALGIHLCKTSRIFIFKIRLDGEISMGDVNIHKGYRLLPSFNNPHLQYELI